VLSINDDDDENVSVLDFISTLLKSSFSFC